MPELAAIHEKIATAAEELNLKTDDKNLKEEVKNKISKETLEEEIKKQEDSTKVKVTSNSIYKLPERADSTTSTDIDGTIAGAEGFIQSASNTAIGAVKIGSLQSMSQSISGILLAVGIGVAVVLGVILGIKLMVSSAEEKAETKKLLVPYVVGCVVVFGGFAIWKLVITILQVI